MTPDQFANSAACLQKLDGSQKHVLHVNNPTSIGRSKYATIRIADDSVSRIHAIIFWDGQHWNVLDTSNNGTFVNDQLIHKQQLITGDTLRFSGHSQWGFIGAAHQDTDSSASGSEVITTDANDFSPSITIDNPVYNRELTLVGRSQSISALLGQIVKIAKHRSSVYLQGEFGTGKQRVARSIHAAGPEKNQPIITINCKTVAIHELQSFQPKILMQWRKLPGTIVLNGLTELSSILQEALVELLQQHADFARQGAFGKISPRWIALSEHSLIDQEFNPELLTRLSVTQILLDPLRDRPQDIGPLAYYFKEIFADKWNKNISNIQDQVIEVLEKYNWPGNTHEFKNVIERAVMFHRSGELSLKNLTSGIGIDTAEIPNYEEHTLEEVEAEHILLTLVACKWKKTQAAEILGIERSTLDRKIKKYELTKSSHSRNWH